MRIDAHWGAFATAFACVSGEQLVYGVLEIEASAKRALVVRWATCDF